MPQVFISELVDRSGDGKRMGSRHKLGQPSGSWETGGMWGAVEIRLVEQVGATLGASHVLCPGAHT